MINKFNHLNLFKLSFLTLKMENNVNIEQNPSSKLEVKTEKKPLFTSEFYDRNYKKFLILPALMLIFAVIYLISFYAQTGDIMRKDVSLTGGTLLTVYTENFSVKDIENALKDYDISIRVLTNIETGKQIAFTVETESAPDEFKGILENYLNYKLDEDNSSIEFTGTSLSQSFYKELIIAMLLAFVFMSIVIFIIFKIPLPSFYVILCAATDILVPIAVIDIWQVKVSTAGIAAFLMLIGYSVDTDILLTTRVLKHKEEVLNKRIFSAMKTGLTMSLTSFTAVFIAYFLVISPVLKQVFLIISLVHSGLR